MQSRQAFVYFVCVNWQKCQYVDVSPFIAGAYAVAQMRLWTVCDLAVCLGFRLYSSRACYASHCMNDGGQRGDPCEGWKDYAENRRRCLSMPGRELTLVREMSKSRITSKRPSRSEPEEKLGKGRNMRWCQRQKPNPKKYSGRSDRKDCQRNPWISSSRQSLWRGFLLRRRRSFAGCGRGISVRGCVE